VVERTWIKVCGIRRRSDAFAAAEAGVDAIGFVFAESPRRIDPTEARLIARDLPTHILRFGVFVDATPADIARIVTEAGLDRVQLHGFEEPMVRELVGSRVIKAFRARDESVLDEIREWAVDTFIVDTWSPAATGGTGHTFDWSLGRRAARLGRMVLAGGLTPENVGRALQEVEPFGVDVSSGVEESPGVKDPEKIRAFVEAVRASDRERGRAGAPSR
jgi:phosphoribosylanthranilate isomerase